MHLVRVCLRVGQPCLRVCEGLLSISLHLQLNFASSCHVFSTCSTAHFAWTSESLDSSVATLTMLVPAEPADLAGADEGLVSLGHGEGRGRVTVAVHGPGQDKTCQDALTLRMVLPAAVVPPEARLFHHPNASATHAVQHGSGVFLATAETAVVGVALNGRSLQLRARTAGQTVVHVADVCIVPKLDLAVVAHVFPVAAIRVHMYDKVELSKSVIGVYGGRVTRRNGIHLEKVENGNWIRLKKVATREGKGESQPCSQQLTFSNVPHYAILFKSAVVCAMDETETEFPDNQYATIDLQSHVEDGLVSVKPLKVTTTHCCSLIATRPDRIESSPANPVSHPPCTPVSPSFLHLPLSCPRPQTQPLQLTRRVVAGTLR